MHAHQSDTSKILFIAVYNCSQHKHLHLHSQVNKQTFSTSRISWFRSTYYFSKCLPFFSSIEMLCCLRLMSQSHQRIDKFRYIFFKKSMRLAKMQWQQRKKTIEWRTKTSLIKLLVFKSKLSKFMFRSYRAGMHVYHVKIVAVCIHIQVCCQSYAKAR